MDFDFLANDSRIKICLPLYVRSACADFHQSKGDTEDKANNHHFILTLSGMGKFTVRDKNYSSNKGKLLFIRKGVPYSYTPITDDWHVCFITFNGSSADKLLNHYGFGDADYFDDEYLSDLLISICNSADEKIDEEQLSNLLYDFLNETGAAVFNIFLPKPLVKAKRHIIKNYTRASLNINEIIEVSGTSATKLFKMFKQMELVTPAQFLINIRMNHAKDLLLSTVYNVTDIAQTVGYETANYFSSAFRHHVGMSPLEYRKKYFGRSFLEVNKERQKGPTDEEFIKIINKYKNYKDIKKCLKEEYNVGMDDMV